MKTVSSRLQDLLSERNFIRKIKENSVAKRTAYFGKITIPDINWNLLSTLLSITNSMKIVQLQIKPTSNNLLVANQGDTDAYDTVTNSSPYQAVIQQPGEYIELSDYKIKGTMSDVVIVEYII